MEPFVYWKEPDGEDIFTIHNPVLFKPYPLLPLQTGFWLCPFWMEQGARLLRGEIVRADATEMKLVATGYPTDFSPLGQPDYRSLVKIAVEQIDRGKFHKVVLARADEHPLPEGFDLKLFFSLLCSHYPSAFVYCVGMEDQIWTGASPELFIRKQGGEFTTYALAGTRSNAESDLFGEKERKEQGFVKEYILDLLNELKATSIRVSELSELNTGQIIHLINTIRFGCDSEKELIERLHPTPAVCGYPLEGSRDFIRQNEGFPRDYYSGFLGPVRNSDDYALWVNLRCARIANQKIRYYAGAGIVHGSDPASEWFETEKKMDTLRVFIGNDD